MTVANTATRAVVFSGTAFALAMIAMLLVPDTTLRSLGLGAVIVGVVSIVVALTFHPGDPDGPRRPRRPPAGAVARAARRRLGGRGGPALAARRARGHAPPGDQPGRHHRSLLLALASPVLGLQMGAAGTSCAAERHGRQAGPASRCSATSPAARPTPSTSSSTARANDAGVQAGPDAPARPSSPATVTSPPAR